MPRDRVVEIRENAFRRIRLMILAGPRKNSALRKIVEREKVGGPGGI
jgi:hypothetical protein